MFFFFNDTATTEIYTLSLHDALPIYQAGGKAVGLTGQDGAFIRARKLMLPSKENGGRSEEHTSELQSQSNLVCRLLLEKKKKKPKQNTHNTPKELYYLWCTKKRARLL